MISCLASEMSRTISDELALEDVVLDAVELDRHLAQHRERRIDAGVDDLVEQVAGALREGRLAQVLLLAVALEHRGQRRQRDARQRDQVVGTHEQVELGGQDPARLLLEHRELQDDEDVVVVLVELGAVVARVDVLVVERVEVEMRLEPVAVGGARRLDVDPADPRRLDDVGRGDVAPATRRRSGRRGGVRADGAADAGRRGSARHHRSRRVGGRGPVRPPGPPTGLLVSPPHHLRMEPSRASSAPADRRIHGHPRDARHRQALRPPALGAPSRRPRGPGWQHHRARRARTARASRPCSRRGSASSGRPRAT